MHIIENSYSIPNSFPSNDCVTFRMDCHCLCIYNPKVPIG